MRVAILTPHFFPSVTGNSVTAGRLAKGLAARGAEVEIVNTEIDQDPARILSRLEDFAPEVLHGLNAFRTGNLLLETAQKLGLPTVLTITGTDAYQNLPDESQRPRVVEILNSVDAIVVFHEAVRAHLSLHAPGVVAKVVVIPQAVDLPEGEGDPLERIPPAPNRFLFLIAAGIRPVKNVSFSLAPLSRLVRSFPQVRLVIAGPILDPVLGKTFLEQISVLPWVHYLEAVPHHQMRALYEAVQVLINSSRSEGGMANSLLEAMSVGVPVLASRIQGNTTIVEDGVNGFLFSGEEEFLEKARLLVADGDLRHRLGEAGRELIRREFPPDREVSSYLRLYRKLIEGIP
ncbi:MAG: glycosyltransferase family 4 protein [Candidatus Tectomicrobia bacterium]|uniref:Glycosyltransferase family 4 protein n=1 Tax=Tectimicrobiota bacterium TaxID=2528274 RepID=A0A932GQG7_UNCTE|nr:glycosyltransferase family 4 protein [Candidatus Tectomicrobia bacterium]